MNLYLIRHGITEGNLKKRYIGKTDEPLCVRGETLLEQYCRQDRYPVASRIFISPMKRCIQTADILYPGQEKTVIAEFAECDFGIFENRNYEELKEISEYQAWIDSGGLLPFPGGESRESFIRRSLSGYEKVLKICRESKEQTESVVCIVHGGTIMSIMETYAVPHGEYYDFRTENGAGYCIRADKKTGKNYKDI